MNKLRCILIGFSLLLIGCGIYAVFKQNIFFLQRFQHSLILQLIKIELPYNDNPFRYFFLYIIPDVLWYSALLFIMIGLHQTGINISRIILLIAIFSPFALEALQYYHCIAGTFDILDILTYLLTILIFVLWIRKKLKLFW
jgi:hypothetical protein